MISRLNRTGASRHSVALSSLPVASRAIADIELFSLRDILGQGSHSSNKQKTEGSQKRNNCNAHSKLLSLVLESLFLSRKRTETVAPELGTRPNGTIHEGVRMIQVSEHNQRSGGSDA